MKVVDPKLISIVWNYKQEVMHIVTKYHNIEKHSTTLIKLYSSKTVNSGGPNRAYVGKRSILIAKDFNIDIIKLLKKKEDEEATAIWKAKCTMEKKTQDVTKAAQEALYQMVCDAALAARLPRPKKLWKLRALCAPHAAQVSRRLGGGKVKRGHTLNRIIT